MVEFLVLLGVAFIIGGCIALRQKWNKVQAQRSLAEDIKADMKKEIS